MAKKDIKELIKIIRNTKDIENIERILSFGGLGKNISKLLELCDKLPSSQDFQLHSAEQQLLGFYYGKWHGSDITGLIENMNLTYNEWKILKAEWNILERLDESDVQEIENHFKEKRRRK